MDYPIAASFMMAYGTSYHALKDRAKLKEGETLLVLGASGGVGFAAGGISKIPLNLALLKGCSIVGVFWGSFAIKNPKNNRLNTMELMKWHAEGKLNPHIHKVYPLNEVTHALEEMMARHVKGKVVIECSS